MKKDRNCNNMTPYPVYPNMYGMTGMMPMMGYMYNNGMSTIPNSIEQQINSLNNKVNMLEKRVSALESVSASPIPLNNYNESNYYMV